MKSVIYISTVIIQLTFSFNLVAQQKKVNLNDSAAFYYHKKDLKKAFHFYEAYFSSKNSSMSNYNAYYAAVSACHAGDIEKAKYYLKKSAEIGYDYVGYNEISQDSLNKCLRELPEWNTFITNYRISTEAKLTELKKISDGLNDTTQRINTSILSNPVYWKEYKEKNTTEEIIKHIKDFNNYPSPKASGFWTLYNIKVNEGLTVPFLLHIPKNYAATKRTALYVYLHGGIANKPNFSTPSGVPTSLEIKVMNNPAAEDAFIIYPFGKKSFGWLYQQDAFITILNELAMVKSLYNIDDNRVYIGGHSNGGSGAFWYAINQPSPFAAFFGLNFLPKSYSSNTPLGNLKNSVPFLGVSGTQDDIFSLTMVNEIYKLAIASNANWQNFTLSGGHTTTIVNRDSIGYLFDDLASKTRNPFPKQIEWETDNVQNGRNLWIEITELDTLAEKAVWHKELNPSLTQQGKKSIVNFNKNRSGAIIASANGNTIEIQTSRVKRIRLYISGEMFDLNHKIRIVINGKEYSNIKLVADKNVIIDEFIKTKDRDFIVANKMELVIK